SSSSPTAARCDHARRRLAPASPLAAGGLAARRGRLAARREHGRVKGAPGLAGVVLVAIAAGARRAPTSARPAGRRSERMQVREFARPVS
ncbi:MAG TPA: hypothetical protein VMD59_14155, partial [Acidimicrobiales bacterium]|nr:hypothetical protein [Acidimicrobiales bacterium]